MQIDRPRGTSKRAAKNLRGSVLDAVKSGNEASVREVVEGLDQGALPYIYLTAFKIWAVQGGELEGHPHQVLGEILKTRMAALGVAVPSLEEEPPPPPNPEDMVRTVKLDATAGDTDFCRMRDKDRKRLKKAVKDLIREAGFGPHRTSKQRQALQNLTELINSLTAGSVLEVYELAGGNWLQDGFLSAADSKFLQELMTGKLEKLTELVTPKELAKRQTATAAASKPA